MLIKMIMGNENHFSQRLLAVAAKIKDSIDLKFSLVIATTPQPDNVNVSIEPNCQQWKNAESFAREFMVNRQELQRVFKHCYDDKGIKEYQADRKIEAACILLSNGKLTIKEIAVVLDYTQNYFSYFFKSRKGMTPTEWQKKNEKGDPELKS